MKNHKPMKKLTLLFICLLLFASCKKKTVATPDPVLPAETQTGANTFGCLVDGKVFVPKGNFTIPGLSTVIQFNILSLGAARTSSNESISFGIRNMNAVNNYDLIFPNEAEYSLKSEQYAPIEGKITVTKYDQVNKILSGRFYFTGKNTQTNKLVYITDGRFDVKYTN